MKKHNKRPYFIPEKSPPHTESANWNNQRMVK